MQFTPRLKPGDLVVRRHRLLKTRGTILRFDGEDENGASRVWVRWRHSTTLPNPSLEPVNDLEKATPDEGATVL
jgi:hypothetical protein